MVDFANGQDYWEEPSLAWRRRETTKLSVGDRRYLDNLLGMISAFASTQNMTIGEMCDYVRVAMVKDRSQRFAYGEKKQVATSLGVHRNTLTKIRKTG